MKKITDDNRKSMIKIRGGYSEEFDIVSFDEEMQLEELSDRTRVIISNKLYILLSTLFEKYSGEYINCSFECNSSDEFCKELLSEVFAKRNNIKKGYSFDWEEVFEKYIHNVVENAVYNEVLDLMWYICEWINNNFPIVANQRAHYDLFNMVFEKENVGYRFVNGRIVQITDKNEIDVIEKVANSDFEGCRQHINNAVAFLADREKKDYKNCVKESISAVESICKVIIGKDNTTLGEALKVLESKRGLKGPLKSAFEKLYSYTNDKGGIRHAEGLFVSNVSFEEAKFMLVSCSAFVNYLVSEYGNINNE